MPSPNGPHCSDLPRVLEPEIMDSEDEAAMYDRMDHGAVNACFVDDFLAGGPAGTRLMDLGTGTARIPILICDRCPSAQVVAIDAAPHMLDVAIRNVDVAGLRDRITVLQADAKSLDSFEPHSCDAVISNSLLHHLAHPRTVLKQAKRLVKPGGRIFIRDLLRPETAQRLEELVAEHAGDEPPAAQQLLRQSLHAALTLDEAREMLRQCDIDPSQVRVTSDRHWTISADV